MFRPDAPPSNPAAYGLPIDPKTGEVHDDLDPVQEKAYNQVLDRIALHREVMRGAGFYDWMTSVPISSKAPSANISSSEQPSGDLASLDISNKSTPLRPLPKMNFIEIEDHDYANAIIEEALPEDRSRFKGYLSNRPLGFGMITAGAGFGTTTAGAAATLAMEAKVGKVLCSGPTSVTIDNFAQILFSRSQSIVYRCNRGKAIDDPSRRRHKLVLRAYNPVYEKAAITALLKNPSETLSFEWNLKLSCTFWVLLVLGSPAAGRKLHTDDPAFIHELRFKVFGRNDLGPLFQLAINTITWEQFTQLCSAEIYTDTIEDLMASLVAHADLLCVTPAASERHTAYREWKITSARAVAIDEAACMSRADLCCVWGNTLMPCILCGDLQQLPPTVLTKGNTFPSTDHYVNRFASYGEVSALSALMASGLPVYRLKTQLRMARGMFDLVARVIYPNVPFTYHYSRAIDNPEFKVGHDIGGYLRAKFPELSASSDNTLWPVFVHCQGSQVSEDPKTGSKRSHDQVKIGLSLLSDLVEQVQIDPKEVAVISPYAANIKLANEMRREYPSLSMLPDAATIDSFQGQESTITLAIMGTAHPRPGPGFTQNKRRLNVLLTRHKCALIIVGDINVGDPFRKGTKEPIFKVEGPTGEVSSVKAPALRAVYRGLKEAGRVVTVNLRDHV